MIKSNTIFLWLLVVTLGLLLIPFTLMLIGESIKWSLFDFLVMGILIYGCSSLYVLLSRKYKKHQWLLGAGILVLFVYIWAELAMGIFTNLGS